MNKMTEGLRDYQRKVDSGEIVRKKPMNPQQRFASDTNSRAKAIGAKCFDCTGHQREEIRLCPMADCALYNFRPYK